MIRQLFPWLAPLALLPAGLAGLAMWDRQGARIWLSAFIEACF